MKEKIKTFTLLARYNLKIIFGGKFVWFLLVAALFFVYLLFQQAYDGVAPSESIVYRQLLFPALLLVFYPTVYGISNDHEAKILEILFSIPNYMYKVWLLRLFFVMIETFLILLLLSVLADVLFCPIYIFEMTTHLIAPVTFFAALAFLLSTIVKGGNGTAVLFIFLIVVLMIIGQIFDTTMWNVFIDPYLERDSIHPAVWETTMVNSRLFLYVSSFAFVLISLMNLQSRERML